MTAERSPQTANSRAWPIACALILAYSVMVGATPLGEWFVSLRLVNATLSAVFIGLYLLKAPRRHDRIDQIALMSLVGFSVVAVLSAFPRQSLDALLAMLAYAAILYVAREVLAQRNARRMLVATMALLSVVVIALLGFRQLALVLEVLRLTDGAVFAPIGLPFAGTPWGNKYDLVLVATLLYPACFLGSPGTGRRIAALVLGAVLAVLVVMSGSRNVMIAVAGATAIVAVPVLLRHPRVTPLHRLVVGGGAVAAAAALVFYEPVRDRLLAAATVDLRFSMWLASVEAWLERPISGLGIGSFPWLLQTTSHFDTNSIAPRHADSAIFQLVGEAGAIGVVAALVLLIGLGWPVMRSRCAPAVWALSVFLLAGLFANPTDFAFFVVIAIVWVAIALPRGMAGDVRELVPKRPFRVAVVASSVIIGLIYGGTLVAGFRYEAAFQSVDRGLVDEAIDDLELATMLDPGLAVYHRQLGTARLMTNDLDGATDDLRAALALNPVDDLGWRTLAVALMRLGDTDGALQAANVAVETQRSDPTNLQLLYVLEAAAGRTEPTRDELAELLLAWPSLAAAPGWDGVTGDPDASADAVQAAIDRWLDGGVAPEPVRGQPFTLVRLGGRPDLVADAANLYAISSSFVAPAERMAACETDAWRALSNLPASERRTHVFWEMAMAVGPEAVRQESVEMLAILSGRQPSEERGTEYLNPLRENDQRGFSADLWGYRRLPFPWGSPGIELPDPAAGSMNLLFHWNDIAC